MKKKKALLFIPLILTIFLSLGCSSSLNTHSPDDCPEVFSAGQQDAIEKIQYSAEILNDAQYVNEDNLLDTLEYHYGKDVAYEIRDLLDWTSTSDIVDTVIDEYYWE